jgi:hypothetical protein
LNISPLPRCASSLDWPISLRRPSILYPRSSILYRLSSIFYHLSPSYPIAGICGASSSMGATCFVRCAKVQENQFVPAIIANVRSPARSNMAWHRHPRRILVSPEYRLWIRLATTRWKFSKENDTQFNRKIHAHDRLESVRFPFDQGSRKCRKFNSGYYIAEILDIRY